MSHPSRWITSSLLVVVLALTACGGTPEQRGWTYYGGDKAFTRYAPLEQIDRGNIDDVQILWQRPSIDASYVEAYPDLVISGGPDWDPGDNLRSTPIFVDGVLYAPNGVGLVEAFDPTSGETIWLQEPFAPTLAEVAGRSTRGLDYWTDGTDRRLILVKGGYLYTLDPETGSTNPDFGDGGRVNLVRPPAERYNWSSGPIVVGDVVVIGGVLDGEGDSGNKWRGIESEDVRGFDVRSGELLWTFHVVPEEGEFGVDTWEEDSWREAGDQGSWCCFSADEELGYVYVPVSAPTSAYYGGHRPGDNLFSNSLVVLDATTGERVWHFQMVHHDLWEYDTVGPPSLGEITVDGRRIKAVMQPSKTGWVYVFDRETGEPVWPIEERPVPQSTVPGEHTSPTQPFPTKPAPFARQGLTVDDLLDFPEVRDRALAFADSFTMGPIFTPPPLAGDNPDGKYGLLQVPGIWGAGNWNTGAFDPETGMYYAVAHTLPRIIRISKGDDPDSEMEYWGDMDWSPDGGDQPIIDGLPITKPPWGRITAIDMNTGDHVWMAANGDALGDHPALEGLDLPPLGISSRPAALVTKTLLFLGDGGNVFGGIYSNMWGNNFRAYDKATGEVIWEMELPAGVTGGPMTYMSEGKQYIVVPIGGSDHPAEWVALGLP